MMERERERGTRRRSRRDNLTDGNASFLRAARAGNLDKVVEWLRGNVDINTSNANGLNALHLASKEGHVNVVTELIRRGANVNAATKKGNASLHIASLAGQEEVVKILVQNGANVNVQSQNGFTPLYMAAQENHDDVLRFLLANGANQSLATEDGFTPLAVALQQGHDKVVALLLENDTKGKVRLPALHIAAKKDDCKAAALLLQSDHNPDVTSKSGFTPLHIAAHYGNDNIASLLLEKGADVNFTAKHQITPLHVAAKWGKANMVSLLIEKGANIDASTRDGLTPLHCAARSGHDNVVDQLLENGAPISAKTKNGLAPLHMSSQGDHVDSARILLYHKAPVDDITVDYLTALHVAAHCGHVNVAKLLLDRSADPNSRALNGFTPLHIACKKNRIKVVELLLKHGASIEATTESGLTPLHVASFMGCMNIVIYLIQNRANPDVPTVRGETPLHLAARANQTDIIRILLRNGAHVDAAAREEQTPLHIAARLGNVDIVSLLLQHSAAVDATTKDLYTALHVAAKEGQEEVASVLLDHGASLTTTTKKGLTPLHMAAKYGNIKVARLLLHKDAPVDAQGKNGVTPLHVAAHYDHVNVALLLLDKGASPHATAKNGYTPLHISAKKNQMDIATTLLEYGAKAGDESKAGFTSLHLAAQEGHTDMATLLIEHNADVNAKAKNGLTPLHLCAQEDKVNVAAILVKNGAEIDPQTRAGYTPLHVACHFGQINMVRFLLQHDADVNSTTSHGYTPLHQAAQQGHSLIINLLLENQASPNITSAQGQTPLSIAQRLGYISVVETLKVVTETVVTTTTTTVVEEKYKVVAPETMQETFMSDSEDEGGDDTMLGDQSYRYLTADEMKSLGDDSLPIDVTKDERTTDSMTLTKESAAPLTVEEDHLSPQHAQMMETSLNGSYSPDNIDISHAPIHAGDFKWDDDYLFSAPSNGMWRHSRLKWKTFLVSFMVDARGGAMRGCRHSGVRVIIPPRKAPMPMRITCRYLRKEKLAHPPPLMEGEACASRILEMGPVAARFLGPVIIEVPHFASLRGKEREITILRSDNGETWREHALEASEEAVQEVLNESFEGEELSALEDLNTNRITRILTTDFPQYFAIITRIRQEVHAVGPEGGMVSSAVVPQVQAIFPEGALTKKIKVGLQAQPIQPDLVAKLLGNRVAVSPIVTVEPRRRKFHKPITLTIPVPQAATKGMINQYSGDAPTLRLLCSITGSSKSGGPSKAQWEDVTGSTPLSFVNECVSFTTTVSARFWLMDCRQVSEATKFATELYQEAIHVPFMGKFVIFAKRHEMLEAQLRVFCMTDDKEDKTLESQEHFIEIAKSRDVEVLENKHQYLEFAGNLVPVTKSGDQLFLTFHAFRENRLPFSIRVKDPLQEPMGRIAFMKEPRAGKSEPQQTPICNLNIALPEICKMDVAELVTLERKYGFVQEIGLAKPELIHRADLRLSDIARELDKDWVALALQLDISEAEINSIKSDCPDDTSQQALIMLRRWMQKSGPRATGNQLEKALRKINREDIPKHCMFNVELVTDDVEKAVAKVHLDQSGFETFKEELGPSRDASLKREASLDVSYDEQDLMKEAESTVETSSESEHIRKDTQNDILPKEYYSDKKKTPSPSSEGKEEPTTPIVPIAEEPKLSEDIKHVTSAVVESQEVLEDGTVKRTVTTVTTTTVVMDGEEVSEQDIQDHTAKLAESETWASEMDTSQVSISSLPEDEKSEPTTATISSSTAAEPEPDIAETPTEDKEWSESDEKADLRQTVQTAPGGGVREDGQPSEGKEDKDAVSFESHCDSTLPEASQMNDLKVTVTEKSEVEQVENGDAPVTTECKDLLDQGETTIKEPKYSEDYNKPTDTEMRESTPSEGTVPVEMNGMAKEGEEPLFEPEHSCEDDINAADTETKDYSMADEIPVDVTGKPDIEPELESDAKPVVTTPVSERKHKPESKPRSHIPVYDVTGKYEGPEIIEHTEPIIIEPDEDKDSLTIDRHHSTPDFRQLAGSDLEAILEEHAKDEQLRAASESAGTEDDFSPLHKWKPKAHPSISPSEAHSPDPKSSTHEVFHSTAESDISPAVEYSPNLLTKSFIEDVVLTETSTSHDFMEISVETEQEDIAVSSKDVSPTAEMPTEVSELHSIETTLPTSSSATVSVTNQVQDKAAFPPNRTQMAFDNSAFVGVDMIDLTDTIDRDMARSPYEVVRRDIEDFQVEDVDKSLITPDHPDMTELTKCDMLPTREEATKLAQEIIEEIKTEVAKRPPLQQVSSEISDEDLVEHEEPLGVSASADTTDLKQIDATFLVSELSLEPSEEDKKLISEKEATADRKRGLQETEYQKEVAEKICEEVSHSKVISAVGTQESISVIESTTSLPLLDDVSDREATEKEVGIKIEKEFVISYPKTVSDSAESETIYGTLESLPVTSSPDDSFGSSGSDVKQQATSDAIEADMHDSDSCLWDTTHRCSGQYIPGELVDEMAESVISQTEETPTVEIDLTATAKVEKSAYHINGPLEVDYVPEYDDEKYIADESMKDHDESKDYIVSTDSFTDGEKVICTQIETSEVRITDSSKIVKQILPTVEITEAKETKMHLMEEDEFLPQRVSLFDDQADQEIKKILSDESQTEDDRITDIIERPLTPEPSEDVLADENLLPESEQSSHLTDSSETVKHELIREEINESERSFDQVQRAITGRTEHSSFLDEISSLEDATSSKTIESFQIEIPFQQDDYTQEEAMDIGSDKCDDIDESEKPHPYEYGVHFASEPDYDEIPKYVESGYGDLYTHQEEDEDIFDDDMQESRNLVDGEKQIYPDLDNLLGPKFYTKSGEHDDSSMSSLQEFERFEAEIATGRKLSQGSVDSLNDHPPTSKSGEHDDVSMNSLTEFERLERECAEAERIENVACEEAARLSEIEEGHESQASEASHETLSGPEDMDSIDSDDYEKRLSEIDEIIRQAQCNVEKFQGEAIPIGSEHTKQSKKILLKIAKGNKDITVDKSSSSVSKQLDANILDGNLNRVDVSEQEESKDLDSLEDNISTGITGPHVDLPSTGSHDVDLDSLHEERSHSVEHDSLHEIKQDHEQDSLREDKTGDLDSLQEEVQILMQDSLYEERDLDQDSLHESIDLPKDEIDDTTSNQALASDKKVDEAEFEDSLHEELCTSGKDLERELYEICTKVDCMISSTDSLEPSSSAGTHATYQFDTDSIMSSSLNSVQTSGEETLMASSTDSIDPERISYMYANTTIADYSIPGDTHGNYMLDSEGNVQRGQAQTGIDKEGNINSSLEAIQKLHSVDNMKKVFTMSSENILHEDTKTILPTELKVKLKDSESLPTKQTSKTVTAKSVTSDSSLQHILIARSDSQGVQSSISLNGDIDQEGNLIKKDSQLSQDIMLSSKARKFVECSKEEQKEKSVADEDSLRTDLSGETVTVIPSTKPGEQIEEIRTTDEHGNIRIIRRIKRVITVQRDSVSSPESGKSDISEPVEEVRTTDEKGNVRVIRRIRRVIRLSDSQSSDIDKQQLQGIIQNDDSQATSPDISQADSLQERINYETPSRISDQQITPQELKSGRESVCSIRSDFSDTDSDIREFRTTDEKGNIIIRRVRRIVTPLPPESSSRSSSPHHVEPSVEEKRIVDDKGNVIIRRVKRIIKVQQSDSSESEDLSKTHSTALDDKEKSEESKIIDEDGHVKIIKRTRRVVQASPSPQSCETTSEVEDYSQQSIKLGSDVPNGGVDYSDHMLPPKHTTYQLGDGETFEEIRTLDERGNVKITRIRKKTTPWSKTSDKQDDSDDVEERLRDFLKSSSIDDCAKEEEAKEERTLDEKGNVVIVRTIKRHTVSEPQIHSKTFIGPHAEQQSEEFIKTFDSLQSREDISQHQAVDDEGNVIRVTQEVHIEPHIKTLSFAGPNARQQMDDYMKLHKDSSQTLQSSPQSTIHTKPTSDSDSFMQSRTDVPSHTITDDPYSSLETVLPPDTSLHHQVESNGTQLDSGTALQLSKEQRGPQRSVRFEDFIHQDVEPTSDGKDSSLDVGLQHDQSVSASDVRMADKNAEEHTDHSKLPL